MLTTSRFPADAALRFASCADFHDWRGRLEIVGPLELANVALVEAFCSALLSRFKRIHVLINNAAQTLTRAVGWEARMMQLEEQAERELPPTARGLMLQLVEDGRKLAPRQLSSIDDGSRLLIEEACSVEATRDALETEVSGAATAVVKTHTPSTAMDTMVDVPKGEVAADTLMPVQEAAALPIQLARVRSGLAALTEAELRDFPVGRLDESLQPLDLSEVNSWSRRLGEVSTSELLHTMAANAVAPFILCSRLIPVLEPSSSNEPCGLIVNVSALEGKFTVGKKSSGHPHTNMSKAALNMLTLTCAGSLRQRRVLVNAVDTGWVTDMAPVCDL